MSGGMPRLRGLAALAAFVVGGGTWALAGPENGAAPRPAEARATPAQPKLSVRVGERLEFAVDPAGGARGRWQLDGATVATGPTWTFAPSAADVGRHVVLLGVTTGGESASRRWNVRVTPPRLPRVATASPAGGTVSVDVDREVVLRFDARPAAPGESVRVVWTVDGQPAGEGDTLRWRGTEPANVRARALALGSLGAAVGHEWTILVRAPATTTTTLAPTRMAEPQRVELMGPLPPSGPERARGEAAGGRPPPADVARAEPEPREQPTEQAPDRVPVDRPRDEPALREAAPQREVQPAAEPPPREVPREELPTATLPPPPPPTLPPPPPPPPTLPPTTLPPAALASRGTEGPTPGGDDEIRRLLDRYAAAWRNHDVGELRRLGQVTSDSQAADLERYFAKVEDLDVEVNVIEIRSDGDRATVRFTRRDRFRDPAGRLVTQESPPIEKRVVRSPDGLRFEPKSR
jgi:hypothetical protein